MKNLAEKLARFRYTFLQTHYGSDLFNNFLTTLAIVLLIIGLLFNNPVLQIVGDAVVIYALFRCFSRNKYKRSIENKSFLTISNWGRHLWKATASNMKDQEHKYFVCPECHQIVRVPRGRGEIEIKCPTCEKVFNRKS